MCPAREFGCGCSQGECQSPNHHIINHATQASTMRVLFQTLILGILIGIMIVSIMNWLGITVGGYVEW